MFGNIVLAIIIALLTAIVAGLAGQLAATKTWQKWCFWGAGFLTVVLIGVQTYRNETTQTEQKSQLDKIQKNTETPPKVNVTIPPPNPSPVAPKKSSALLVYEKTEFIDKSLAVGQRFGVNVYLRNIGSEPAYNARHFFAVKLVSGALKVKPEILDQQTHREFRKQMRQAVRNDVARYLIGSDIANGQGVWATFGFNSLTSEQVNGIVNGDVRFYVYVWANWDNDQKDLESCQWLQATGSVEVNEWKPVWHYCGG